MGVNEVAVPGSLEGGCGVRSVFARHADGFSSASAVPAFVKA